MAIIGGGLLHQEIGRAQKRSSGGPAVSQIDHFYKKIAIVSNCCYLQWLSKSGSLVWAFSTEEPWQRSSPDSRRKCAEMI
jgi:hypothetical protein